VAVLLADGGASRNDLLMQCQADILGRPVLRSSLPDLSALGAPHLAGLAIGMWPSEEAIAHLACPHDRSEPHMSSARREELYGGWRRALERALLDAKAGASSGIWLDQAGEAGDSAHW